ncbi:MAG: hypothetical protein LBE34_01750 [Flavobacteriaceae bacterium]|jgi:hypothetical protein|nr:hypothetical protein [Flavobacteriaceae bacterium]
MKKLLYILFFSLGFALHIQAQNKGCEIDYEIKNDSVNIKKTTDYLMYEKDFGRSTKSIFMSLINSEGLYFVQLQYLQKDSEFIPITCINHKSIVTLKLLNGKIVNAFYLGDEKCDSLMYDNQEKNNIRVLMANFILRKEDIAVLKESPVSTMQIRFSNKTEQFIIRETIQSEITKTTYTPSVFIQQNLKCIE